MAVKSSIEEKFSQASVIQDKTRSLILELAEGGNFDDAKEESDSIKDGICYFFVASWIQRLIEKKEEEPRQRMDYLRGKGKDVPIRLAKKIPKETNEKMIGFFQKSFTESEYKFRKKDVEKDEGKTMGKWVVGCTSGDSCYAAVGVRTRGGEGGHHAIGIFHDYKKTSLYSSTWGWKALVFDPNTGETMFYEKPGPYSHFAEALDTYLLKKQLKKDENSDITLYWPK